MRQLAGASVLIVLLVVLTAALGPNQPEFWGDDCHKVDESQGAEWTADRDYRLVVVKAGTVQHEFYNVEAGDVLSVGKDISHLILCTGGTPSTSTTTTSSDTSSTTTTPPSTTTMVDTTQGTSATTTSSSLPQETSTTTTTTTRPEGTTTSTILTTTTRPDTTSTTLSNETTTTVDPTSTTTQDTSTTTETSLPSPKELPLTGVHLTAWAGLAALLLITGLVVRHWSRENRS